MGFPCRCCNPCQKVNQPVGCNYGVPSNSSAGVATVIHTAYAGTAEGTFNFSVVPRGVSTFDNVFEWRNELPAPPQAGQPNDTLFEHTEILFSSPDCEIDLTDSAIESLSFDLYYFLRGYVRLTYLVEQNGVMFGMNFSKYDNYGGTDHHSFQSVGNDADRFREVISYNHYGTTPSVFQPAGVVVDIENGATPDFSKGAPSLKVYVLVSWWGNWISQWNTPPFTGNPNDQGTNLFELKSFCITAKPYEQECEPTIQGLAPHEHWFRGPSLFGGNNSPPETGRETTSVQFARFFGSAYCIQNVRLDFDHEDADGWRYFRHGPYKTIDDQDAYWFARHRRCKTFVNSWISLDPDAWQMPSDCSDSSNYLPIWDNGIGPDDDFDPLNPVDPIYIFGHETGAGLGGTLNWQARMFGLNMPKRFYRYLDKIEVRNFTNFFPSGEIDLHVRSHVFGSAPCPPVDANWNDWGTIDVSNGTRPFESSPPVQSSDDVFPAFPNQNTARGHVCFSQIISGGGPTNLPVNSGGWWQLFSTAVMSYGVGGHPAPYQNLPVGWHYGWQCSPSWTGWNVNIVMNWLNGFQTGTDGEEASTIGFYCFFFGGSGAIIGEFEGTLTDDWSFFSNFDPINKSVDVLSARYFLRDVVLGEFEARGVYVEDF